MAPEQWLDTSQVTEKADVFSLGAILYVMLGGPLPVTQPLQPVSTKQVMALLGAMTSYQPADRPSMAEVAQRLRDMAGSSPVPMYRPQLIAAAGVLSIVASLLLTAWSLQRQSCTLPSQPDPDMLPVADLGLVQERRDLSAPRDMADHDQRAEDLSVHDASEPLPPPPPPPPPPTQRCPPHFSARCVRGVGLADELRQVFVERLNYYHLRVCSSQPLVLLRADRDNWYTHDIPVPKGLTEQQVKFFLSSTYVHLINTKGQQGLSNRPTRIEISCVK